MTLNSADLFPDMCRAIARIIAEQAVWAARRVKRHAGYSEYHQVPANPAPNIIENATRAAYAVLEPWYLQHGTELCEIGDYTPAPPDALFEAAIDAAIAQF